MIRGWWRWVRELLDRRRLDRDLDEELATHVTLRVDHHLAAGLAADEARRRALCELGLPDQAAERVRDDRAGALVDRSRRELAGAVGALRRAPLTTTLAVGATAVGIGAVAVLLTLIDGVLMRPLPYPRSDQLVHIYDTHPASGIVRTGLASGNVPDLRSRTTTLTALAAYYTIGRTIGGHDSQAAEVVVAAQTTSGYFDLMGTPPIIGRAFTADEYERATFNSAAMPVGPDPVVLISTRLWNRRFGASPEVLHQSLTIDRRPFRIVGVMPGDFGAPTEQVDLWLPWHVGSTSPRDQHYLGAVGRLREGITVAEAQDDLNRIAQDLGASYPATNRGWHVQVVPLLEATVGDTRGLLWTLLGAAGVMLMVACATVAIMSLARGLDHATEIAVRVALGASRGRIMRQCLLESAVVTTLGGALGVIVAWSVVGGLPAWLPDVPRLNGVHLDTRVAFAVVVVVAAAGLVAGIPPAWQAGRLAGTAPLLGPRVASGAGHHRLRDLMVVGQVGLAVVLLVGSGLTARTVQALRATAPGFDATGVVVAPVFLDSARYDSGAKVRAYYDQLFSRLALVPGVTAVGSGTTVPAGRLGPEFARPVWPHGSPETAARVPAAIRIVTPGYFSALRIPARDGRPLGPEDRPDAPRVVVVNDTLATRLWPSTSAVGQRLVIDYSTAGTYDYEVVGVVADLRHAGPRSESRPEAWLPHAQRSYLAQNVVIRTSADSAALARDVRRVMVELDPDKPPHAVVALRDLLADTYARDRELALVLVVLAIGSVMLALLSVWSVLAHRVREREREIGIRVALGADRLDVVRWIATAAVRLVASGAAAGGLLAMAATAGVRARLYGVDQYDAWTYGLVMAVMVVFGVIALSGPTARALRVDPVEILRRS